MQTILGILVAFLVFGVMIFLHELGHYLAARACKVKVLEFAVGMGPKIFSRTSKKTDIVYSLRALPIGGFTAMQGEEGEDDDPHALVNRPRWQKLIVLFAGSVMNILSGMIAMFILLAMTRQVGSCVIGDFERGIEPVSDAWLQEEDEILKIDGSRIIDYTDIGNTIALKGTEPVDILVLRDGQEVLLEDVVFPTETVEGVTMGMVDFRVKGVRPTLGVLLKQTVTQSVSTVKMIYNSLVDLITGKYGMEAVSGPVGTVSVISTATSQGFVSILSLFSFISLNLGVMNLLPLPALDGGRILFTLVECVMRRKLNPKVEGYVHLAGMVVLLAFMAFVTVLDVKKLF
ncbi:MAG: site-2 protease family protein [Clostridia bacterium]|nr:site-2 protease family protein [Clostridia bacterium]